ncbi:LLM class flavin-dependent oxidoreductase [Jiangella mangrovi]|uniref:Alkanesulfonate monooxygenase SsuD/methylene tetrahydromethanopterin reductase-like flavin-dependent oxidoreductase (Luciferase family) n=1 Tax=Jiangella mangrovi TaxID=1524084 RepID=A0A7W9GPB8_9ACTN|nr:alkanesulfonate monooxygenase SsuD/methylene tetrahydromethanopterin reductase-like flavin-dependent oxidoreductase (luciferase family) [Jiangella mangrovi]
MNYGHRLEFGTFITPTHQSPQQPVALAQLSEQLGFDVVTFQDHPYQPAFLDTWTLLTWVAAQTSRVRLSANVHSIPLRTPAVLARAAASLDLLSGGRAELGLGAGGFWDAIEAMGGRRLAPGESVTALSEAIDVIRALWDVDARGGARVDGQFYRLDGAKRGPAPQHPIPLWIGALKPRMLRLIGEKGDGWLPSLPYLQPGDLKRGNAIIDSAAEAAGRDPREIRRLVNISGRFSASRGGFLQGTSQDWVDDLLPLVVEDGVGTFIVMGDDPRTLQQFAEEVMPALRSAVDDAVPGGSAGSRVRPSVALAARRPGIDYDGVPAALVAGAVEPGDPEYRTARGGYLRGGSPGLVLRPTSTSEVVEAMRFARRHPDLPLGVRSGGHGLSGRSTNDGGLVIDVGRLDSVTVLDASRRLVRVGAGARWGDVAAALEPHGWALSSGDYGGVGVGGLATAGGIGYLSRSHGLTIDHLVAAEIVLADGSVVRADESSQPDLFWALRGAGGNFGIVTSFDFVVDEVGDVGWGFLTQVAEDPADYLVRWGAAVEEAPRDLSSFLVMGPPRNGQPAVAQSRSVVESSDPEVVVARLQEIASIAPLYDQEVTITSYASIMQNAGGTPHVATGEPLAHSGLLEHITPEFAAAAAAALASGAIYFFQIRSVGGAVSDVPADATAYAYRSANFQVTAMGASPSRMAEVWATLYPFFDGLYLSFETDQSPDRLADAFPPATLARLQELKHRYDPDNVFRHNFNLAPDDAPAEVAS